MSIITPEFLPNTPGIYKIPVPEYDKAPGVRSSHLKVFANQSPEHAKWAMDHPKEQTRFMAVGEVLHAGFLEPDLLSDSYYLRPDTYPAEGGKKDAKVTVQKPWNGNSNWCKEWLAEHSDRPVITQTDLDNVNRALDKLKKHKFAKGIHGKGMSEISAFAYDEFTSVFMKCRVDKLVQGNDGLWYIFDPKKCQDASVSSFSWKIKDYGYDLQMVYYSRILRTLGLELGGAFLIAIEEQPPHGINVFELNDEQWSWAEERLDEVLKQWADCVLTKEWPGYPEEIVTPVFNRR